MKNRITLFLASLLGCFAFDRSNAARIEPRLDSQPNAKGLSVFDMPRQRQRSISQAPMYLSPASELMSHLGNAKVNGRSLPRTESAQIQAEIIQAAVDRRRRRALRA